MSKRIIAYMAVMIGLVLIVSACSFHSNKIPASIKFPLDPLWHYTSSDLITSISGTENGILLVRTDNALFALEITDNEIMWEIQISKQVMSSLPYVLDSYAFITDIDMLRAIIIDTGEIIWKQVLSDSNSWVTSADSDIVIVNYPSDNSLNAFDTKTGLLLWRLPVGRGLIPSYLYGDNLFIPDYGIRVVDKFTGDLVWSQGTVTIASSTFDFNAGLLYYLDGDSDQDYIVAFDVNARKVVWKINVIQTGLGDLKIVENFIVFCDSERISIYSKSDGKQIWQVALASPNNPVLIANNIYFIGQFSQVISSFDIYTGVDLGSLRVSKSNLLFTRDIQNMVALDEQLVFFSGKNIYGYGK